MPPVPLPLSFCPFGLVCGEGGSPWIQVTRSSVRGTLTKMFLMDSELVDSLKSGADIELTVSLRFVLVSCFQRWSLFIQPVSWEKLQNEALAQQISLQTASVSKHCHLWHKCKRLINISACIIKVLWTDVRLKHPGRKMMTHLVTMQYWCQQLPINSDKAAVTPAKMVLSGGSEPAPDPPKLTLMLLLR